MPTTTSESTKVILLFGATGDLAREKIYPALNALAQRERFTVLGLGRRYADHAEFIEKHGMPLPGFSYVRYDTSEHSPEFLANEILERVDTTSVSLTSYLSLPPQALPDILRALSEVHRTIEKTHVLEKAAVVEKPFGHDALSAEALENQLLEDYEDDEIFRVDHYLGKTFILNLLSLRFQNDLIARVWNRDSIENIQIIVDEEKGIEGREGYYAQMGVLTDMVQNHMLQIAALLTMNEPVSFSARDIARAKYDALRRMTLTRAAFGRYEGSHGRPTAVAARLDLKGPLSGVPVYLRSGKKFGERHATIIIRFSRACSVCGTDPPANELTITIQPQMRIEFSFNVKRDDSDFEVEERRLEYHHASIHQPTDYERIFERILGRDRIIFPTYPEIAEQWRIVDIDEADVFVYKPGSIPEEIRAFVEADRSSWAR